MTQWNLQGQSKQGYREPTLPGTGLLGLTLAVIFLTGCTGGQQGRNEVMSTTMDISSYAAIRQRLSGSNESTFNFPELEIYNQARALVYRSHESTANAEILKDFPNRVLSLRSQEHAPNLREVIESVPDFKIRQRQVLDGTNLVILSITLEGCQSCRIQESALGDFKQKILQQPSVRVLEIHVSHP
jgi:hypothetical protein